MKRAWVGGEPTSAFSSASWLSHTTAPTTMMVDTTFPETLAEIQQAIDATTARLRFDMSLEDCTAILVKDGLTGPLHFASHREISNYLHTAIGQAVTVGHDAAWHRCREWLKSLIFQHLANKGPWAPYYWIIASLRDGMRNTHDDGAQPAGNWQRAIQYAVDIIALNPSLSHEPSYSGHEDVYWKAGAAVRLSSLGRSRNIGPVSEKLDQKWHHAILKHIHKLASHIGGDMIAAHLFRELAPLYDSRQARYHFVNRFSSMLTAVEARVPANFLLQLAAKFPLARKPWRRDLASWHRLRQVCIDYAALYGVQPHSGFWVTGEGNPSRHSHLLWELAIHDALFTLEQVSPAQLRPITEGLLHGLQTQNALPLDQGRKVRDVVELLTVIHHRASSFRGPVTFKLQDIQKMVPHIEKREVSAIVRNHLAHPVSGANQRYVCPTQVQDLSIDSSLRDCADFWRRPLLALDSERMLLLDSAACSTASLEVILAVLRNSGVTDEAVGKSVEEVVLQSIRSCRIKPHFGIFNGNGVKGECDAVIEATDAIILIEVKRKSLTRAARAGSDVFALIDLARSMLKATVQTGVQELQLRRVGSLTLIRPDGEISEVLLNGRQILRVAIALQDYGSFQDKRAAEILLSNHQQARFSLMTHVQANMALQKGIKEVNDLSVKLADLNEKLWQQQGEPERWQPNANCWFLSVPQWLTLLDGMQSADDLLRMLTSMSRTLHGSRDFCYELYSARQMHSSAPVAQGTVFRGP